MGIGNDSSVTLCNSTHFSFNYSSSQRRDQQVRTIDRPSLANLKSAVPYVCLDSISFTAPRSTVVAFSPERWTQIRQAMTLEESYTLPERKLPTGINKIWLNHSKVIVTLSAKVMLNRYMELINRFTVIEALSRLNTLPDITFDVVSLLKTAVVHRADVVIDVHVDGDPADYIMLLATTITSPSFTTTVYPLGRINKPQSILFTRILTKSRTSLCIYAKHTELLKSKNKELRAFISLSSVWPIIRFERRLRTHSDVRKAFGVDDRSLSGILDSRCNPVAELFSHVDPAVKLSTLSDNESLSRLYTRLGMEKFIELCGNDIQLIKRRIYARVQSNPAAKFQRIMRFMSESPINSGERTVDDRMFKELFDKLRFSPLRLW